MSQVRINMVKVFLILSALLCGALAAPTTTLAVQSATNIWLPGATGPTDRVHEVTDRWISAVGTALPVVEREWLDGGGGGGCTLKIRILFTETVSSWTATIYFTENIPSTQVFIGHVEPSSTSSMLNISNKHYNGNQNSGSALDLEMNLGSASVCSAASRILLNGVEVYTAPTPAPLSPLIGSAVPFVNSSWPSGCQLTVIITFNQFVRSWELRMHFSEDVPSINVWDGTLIDSYSSSVAIIQNRHYNGNQTDGDTIYLGMNLGSSTACGAVTLLELNRHTVFSKANGDIIRFADSEGRGGSGMGDTAMGNTGMSGNTAGSGSGLSAETGMSGLTGMPGETGMSGLTGMSGETGMSGNTAGSGSGLSAETGMSGLTGMPGETGMSGETGISGNTAGSGSGLSAKTGMSGLTGMSGETGMSGRSSARSGNTGMGMSGTVADGSGSGSGLGSGSGSGVQINDGSVRPSNAANVGHTNVAQAATTREAATTGAPLVTTTAESPPTTDSPLATTAGEAPPTIHVLEATTNFVILGGDVNIPTLSSNIEAASDGSNSNSQSLAYLPIVGAVLAIGLVVLIAVGVRRNMGPKPLVDDTDPTNLNLASADTDGLGHTRPNRALPILYGKPAYNLDSDQQPVTPQYFDEPAYAATSPIYAEPSGNEFYSQIGGPPENENMYLQAKSEHPINMSGGVPDNPLYGLASNSAAGTSDAIYDNATQNEPLYDQGAAGVEDAIYDQATSNAVGIDVTYDQAIPAQAQRPAVHANKLYASGESDTDIDNEPAIYDEASGRISFTVDQNTYDLTTSNRN